MPLVVVFGAGGGTGAAAVRRAAALGHPVRAVVRTPAAHADRFAGVAGVELVAGDVTDAASVADAVRGAHGVVFAAATSTFFGASDVDEKVRFAAGNDTPLCYNSRSLRRAAPRQGVLNVASAAASAGVRRVVLISSAFVSPHQFWHPVRLILNTIKWRLMDAKYEGEQHLRRSGVSYTVIRPGRLLHAPGGVKALAVSQGDVLQGGSPGISRDDVAHVALAALFDDAAQRVTLELVSGADDAAEGQLAHVFAGLVQDAAAPPAAEAAAT